MGPRLLTLVGCLSLGLCASAGIAETIAALRAAPNAVGRLAILEKLPEDGSIFDFEQSTVGLTIGRDGLTVSANQANSPMLIGAEMSMTVGFLGPCVSASAVQSLTLARCGLNSPHIHPSPSSLITRLTWTGSAELNIITLGGPIFTSFVAEKYARKLARPS